MVHYEEVRREAEKGDVSKKNKWNEKEKKKMLPWVGNFSSRTKWHLDSQFASQSVISWTTIYWDVQKNSYGDEQAEAQAEGRRFADWIWG